MRQKSWLCFFVRDRIRYRLDPVNIERVQDPWRTLQIGSGDCDDKCVLLAALCAAIGHVPRFVVQAQQPSQFDHVYCEIWLASRGWLAADPTADGLSGRPKGGVTWRNPAPIEWVYQIFTG
jgi:transglutaminase-like putative cysteine protease